MVRTEYAYWFAMSEASDGECDRIRQKIESGHEYDVVLVTVDDESVAESAVEKLQDVGGEYFVSAHDDQRLLLLRSHAWHLCRRESRDHLLALVDLLAEALELTKDTEPELTRELVQRSLEHLAHYPDTQQRFQHLDERLEYRIREESHHKSPSSRL